MLSLKLCTFFLTLLVVVCNCADSNSRATDDEDSLVTSESSYAYRAGFSQQELESSMQLLVKDMASDSESEQMSQEVPDIVDQVVEQQSDEPSLAHVLDVSSGSFHDDNDDVIEMHNNLGTEGRKDTNIRKWTPEELEEGDKLCADALKLSESNADIEQKTQKEFDLFKQASELGNATAIEMVAYAQLFGVHTDQNISEAREKFSALAKEGHDAGKKGLEVMNALGMEVDSSSDDGTADEDYWKTQLLLVDKGKHQSPKTYYV